MNVAVRFRFSVAFPLLALASFSAAYGCQHAPQSSLPPSKAGSLSDVAETVPANRTMQEGFRRLTLGNFRITAVSDGTTVRDATELVTRVEVGEVQRLLLRGFREKKMALSINAFLIDDHGRLVLSLGPVASEFKESIDVCALS